MAGLVGNSFAVFLGVTVVIAGGAAFMMGQALARNWRPVWQLVAFSFLLGVADRFLVFALFDGWLLSPLGYLIDTAALLALAVIAYQSTRAYMMVAQYPWLYERTGPFTWREKPGAAS